MVCCTSFRLTCSVSVSNSFLLHHAVLRKLETHLLRVSLQLLHALAAVDLDAFSKAFALSKAFAFSLPFAWWSDEVKLVSDFGATHSFTPALPFRTAFAFALAFAPWIDKLEFVSRALTPMYKILLKVAPCAKVIVRTRLALEPHALNGTLVATITSDTRMYKRHRRQAMRHPFVHVLDLVLKTHLLALVEGFEECDLSFQGQHIQCCKQADQHLTGRACIGIGKQVCDVALDLLEARNAGDEDVQVFNDRSQ